jgi:hypothetical protein
VTRSRVIARDGKAFLRVWQEMKNSKKYSPKVKDLFRSLKQRYSGFEQFKCDDPIETVVMACINEYLPYEDCLKAMKKIKGHFVDFNDLRVARKEEVVEQLGGKIDDKTSREIAASLNKKLNAIFSTYDCLNIDELFELGKRDARKQMEKMWGGEFFVSSFCLLTIFDGHAVPVNSKMFAYLREQKLVNPKADENEICGFLERLISAKDAYSFYSVVRTASEEEVSKGKTDTRGGGKKSVKTKKKAKKKTRTRKKTKKKTTKRKTAKKSSKKTTSKTTRKTTNKAKKKSAGKSKKKAKGKTRKKTKKKTKKARKTGGKTKSKKK